MIKFKPIFSLKADDQIKIRLFKAAVESIVCYGLESIPLTETLSKLIDSSHRRMIRSALGIYWPEKISTKALYSRTKVSPLSKTLQRRRLRLIRHSLRMQTRCPTPLGDILSANLSDRVNLRRGQGRTLTLKADVTNDLDLLGVSPAIVMNMNSIQFSQLIGSL